MHPLPPPTASCGGCFQHIWRLLSGLRRLLLAFLRMLPASREAVVCFIQIFQYRPDDTKNACRGIFNFFITTIHPSTVCTSWHLHLVIKLIWQEGHWSRFNKCSCTVSPGTRMLEREKNKIIFKLFSFYCQNQRTELLNLNYDSLFKITSVNR